MTYTHIQSPLEQFEINSLMGINAPLFGYAQLSITNIGLYFILALLVVVGFNVIANNNNKIIANKYSISQESLYTTILNMVQAQIASPKGQLYFPFIYCLFMLVLAGNFIGMVPYSFAITSHLIFTLSVSMTILIAVTIIGFQEHGLKFFSYFVPAGTPLALVPLLVLIELISYIAKGLSLGIRLGANIMAGHMLTKIIGGFIYQIMAASPLMFVIGIIPLVLLVAITGLELAIAFIQAYVFAILTCSYIKDSLDLH
ncbi:MAG: F0F1 ATP synthase subunit A [Rickettsiales bacterium]|nr:MAG: F0F1 ATP synthase subunit A [Rickettsiales bacterium]